MWCSQYVAKDIAWMHSESVCELVPSMRSIDACQSFLGLVWVATDTGNDGSICFSEFQGILPNTASCTTGGERREDERGLICEGGGTKEEGRGTRDGGSMTRPARR